LTIVLAESESLIKALWDYASNIRSGF